MLTLKNILLHAEARYLLVGSWNTTFAYATFVFIFKTFSPPLNHQGALVISSIIGICNSYFTQRRFVWKSTDTIHNEIYKFATVAVLQLLAGMALLWVCVDVLKFEVLISQFLITIFLIIITFFVLKNWTFKNRNSIPPQHSIDKLEEI